MCHQALPVELAARPPGAIRAGLAQFYRRVELALYSNARSGDLLGTRMVMLGLFVIGAAVGVLIILNDRLPFLAVSAAATLVVFVVLHPMLGIFPTEGAWTFLLRSRLLASAGVVLIAGTLLAVGAWRLLAVRHPDSPIAAQV